MSDFQVDKGQLTFDQEGHEGGTYHSRKVHWPGGASGVTLGRGFDMKERKAADVVTALTAAGVEKSKAEEFSKGAGLQKEAAKNFVANNSEKLGEITPAQQKKLFVQVYDELERDVIRICDKDDVVKTYGKTNWSALNTKIRDVVVDLRYRGDYTPDVRKFLQKTIVANNLNDFKTQICDDGKWKSVPAERHKARKQYLN